MENQTHFIVQTAAESITLRAAVVRDFRDCPAYIWRTDRGNGSGGPSLVELPEDELVVAVDQDEDPGAWELARQCEPGETVAAVYVSEPVSSAPSAYQAIWVLGEEKSARR